MSIKQRLDHWRARRAGKALGAVAKHNAGERRAAMLDELRREIRECTITGMEWK